MRSIEKRVGALEQAQQVALEGGLAAQIQRARTAPVAKRSAEEIGQTRDRLFVYRPRRRRDPARDAKVEAAVLAWVVDHANELPDLRARIIGWLGRGDRPIHQWTRLLRLEALLNGADQLALFEDLDRAAWAALPPPKFHEARQLLK